MAHDALAEILTAEKVPEILITEIGKALTLKSFAMLVDKPCDLEAALHSGLPASASDSITPFVLAGLKAAWAQALKTCASQGPPIALASTGASSSEAATISSWSDAFPAKLSATFTKEIRLRFESSYPGELLDDSSMPSSRLLALAHRYKTDCTYKFIPWKLRLSERAQEELTALRPRKVPKLEDLLYDEVPSRDIPDNGISQMLLYSLLDLAAIAFTMLEAAHLASFRAYNRLFVKLAFRRHTAESGLRGPSVAEMQAADKEAWRVIGDLTSKGWSLDDALHEVVEVRCLLRSELQARAAPPKLPKLQPGGEGRKGGGKGKGSKSGATKFITWITSFVDASNKKLELCKQFNLRSGCSRKDCKFLHKCCVNKDSKPCMGDHPAYKHVDK